MHSLRMDAGSGLLMKGGILPAATAVGCTSRTERVSVAEGGGSVDTLMYSGGRKRICLRKLVPVQVWTGRGTKGPLRLE